MGKLIVSMNLTLDGYMAGADGELDWHCMSWTDEMSTALCKRLGQAGAILLGRLTYEAMQAYWSGKADDPYCAPGDYVFAFMVNSYPKIVCSKTLPGVTWKNARLLRAPLETGIRSEKRRNDKPLMVYGSNQLVQTIIKANLIDEYQLWMHPVILGKGKRLFESEQDARLKLVNTEKFGSGIVLLCYQVGDR